MSTKKITGDKQSSFFGYKRFVLVHSYEQFMFIDYPVIGISHSIMTL